MLSAQTHPLTANPTQPLSAQPFSSQTDPTLPNSPISVRTPQPTALPPLQGLDIQSRYHSARTGGDFFDAIILGPHLVFLLTDIAGSRSSAHTIAACAQDTFRSRASELFGNPGINLTDAISTLAHNINGTLISTANGVCFAPTFLACFDLTLNILTYINAGGQPAIFRDTDGTRPLPNTCMPLGLFTLLTYEPGIEAFEPGARLLLVTKGIVEARSGRTPFGPERVTQLLEDSNTHSASDLCQMIIEQAHLFTRPPWYNLAKQAFTKPKRTEDLTAVALIRPALHSPS